MRVLDTPWQQWRLDEPVALTLGVYDGVHLGHQAVFARLRDLSGGLPRAVFTFRGHPLELSAPDHAPKLLTTYEQKLELLEAAGLDICAVPAFDMKLRTQDPVDFVRDVIVGRLDARLVVVGSDFRFGYQRAGDVDLLDRLGPELGYELAVMELVGGAAPYSASGVRKVLEAGDVRAAAAMLGRRYQLRAPVMRGDGRGRTIGVPTANLDVSERQMVPRRGVYAVQVIMDGRPWPGVVNVGVRPTFGLGAPEVVEVHVLGFDGDLYGTTLSVDFVERVRAEQRFEGVDALVDQIRADIDKAQSILVGASEE